MKNIFLKKMWELDEHNQNYRGKLQTIVKALKH